MNFPRPRILVSRCLGFAACRYNGAGLSDDFIDRLRPYVDFLTVCPEVDLGMTVPRDPIRVVRMGTALRLIQPATGRDYTDPMNIFVKSFLDGSDPVDGAILKSRSPSCGIRDTTYFRNTEDSLSRSRGPGLFAGAMIKRFPLIPVEDETTLQTPRAQDRFLSAVYTWADFRQTVREVSPESLARFHMKNRYFFMARHQSILKEMDRFVMHPAGEGGTLERYQGRMAALLKKGPRLQNQYKILRDYVDQIASAFTSAVRRRIYQNLDEFRMGRESLTTMWEWVQSHEGDRSRPDPRFHRFFEPYPADLTPRDLS